MLVIVGPKKDGKLQVVVWCTKHKFGRDNLHIRVISGMDSLVLITDPAQHSSVKAFTSSHVGVINHDRKLEES